MQFVMRSALLTVQIIVAAFYAWSAVLMWGAFVAGPLAGKLSLTTIVLWPLVGLMVASRGVRLHSLSVTSALVLLTALHLTLVLIIVM